jgi:GT2 family glycosyltransferase
VKSEPLQYADNALTTAAVVVTHNRLSLLQECLDCLRKQSRVPDQIVVVDNGSNDGTAEWLRSQDGVIVYTQANLGCAGGFERGVYEAFANGAQWIWCMDDDTLPESDCLEELLRAATIMPQAGLFASVVSWKDGKVHIMNAIDVDLKAAVVADLRCQLLPIKRASFVSILVSAHSVKAVGLPMGSMFLWFDDVEFTSRIARAFPCYLVMQSVALHKTPVNSTIPRFAAANANNYQRLAMGYRNQVVCRRSSGASFWRTFPFAVKAAVKIALLHLRFGPDWKRSSWFLDGLWYRQYPRSVEAYKATLRC